MTKSVYIKIDPTDLESLKHDKYKICFAKKVANTYDVVWQSYDKFLAGNTFSWIPMYQLFATNTFSGGVQVRADADPVSITLGEQATLDDAGALGPAVSGGPTDSITLKNPSRPEQRLDRTRRRSKHDPDLRGAPRHGTRHRHTYPG